MRRDDWNEESPENRRSRAVFDAVPTPELEHISRVSRAQRRRSPPLLRKQRASPLPTCLDCGCPRSRPRSRHRLDCGCPRSLFVGAPDSSAWIVGVPRSPRAAFDAVQRPELEHISRASRAQPRRIPPLRRKQRESPAGSPFVPAWIVGAWIVGVPDPPFDPPGCPRSSSRSPHQPTYLQPPIFSSPETPPNYFRAHHKKRAPS